MAHSKVSKKRERKKQTRLIFDPVPSSDSAMATAISRDGKKLSPARVRYHGAKSFAAGEHMGSTRGPAVKVVERPLTTIESDVDIQDSSSDTDPLQATTKAESPHDTHRRSQRLMMSYDEAHESPRRTTPFGKSIKKVKKAGPHVDASANSSKEVLAPAPKSVKSRAERQVALRESDDDDHDVISSAAINSTQPFTGFQRFGRQARRPSGFEFSDSEDSSTAMPTPRQSSAKKARRGSWRKSDSRDVTPSASSKSYHKPVTQIEDDSDSEPVLSSPMKRRRSTAPIIAENSNDLSPAKRQRHTVSAIEKDSDDLIPGRRRSHQAPGGSSSRATPSRVTRHRKATVRKHRTEKEKAKELFMRRRNGEKIDAVTDSESDSEDEGPAMYDSDPELRVLTVFDDEEPDEEVVAPKRQQRRHPDSKRANNEDEYDQDFIVDDEDMPLGVPDIGLNDIPLQFRHSSRKPLKDHFKDVVEWMIHKKLDPGFDRKADVYAIAFDRIDKESYGYAISKFISAQWTPKFTRTIKARPCYEERKLERGEALLSQSEDKCEPCNHKKHIPTYGIKLTGRPYDRNTLEELDPEEDSNSASSSDSGEASGSESSSSSTAQRSRDGDGHVIERKQREWLTGAHCRSNALQAHKLLHWRYKLYHWVLDKLHEEGELTAEKVMERDQMKDKRRRQYANDLVDLWEATEVIKGLWKDFNKQLSDVRNAELARGGGWTKRR